MESVARTHRVDEGYLRGNRTPNAFRVFETDIAGWLMLSGPGVMYETVPYKTLAPQVQLACQPAEGNVAAHYLVPLEGGSFEAAHPLEDLYNHSHFNVSSPKVDREPAGNSSKFLPRAPGELIRAVCHTHTVYGRFCWTQFAARLVALSRIID